MLRRAALIFACAGLPAWAEGQPFDATTLATRVWPRAAACEAKLTVQFANCHVSTYYLCPGPGGAVGDRVLRTESMAYDGMNSALISTVDLGFLASVLQDGSYVSWANPAAVPPPDLAEALAGRPQDFHETIATFYDTDVTRIEVVSRIDLAGPDVEIDGLTFTRLTVTSRVTDAPEGDYTRTAYYWNDSIGFAIDGEFQESQGGVSSDLDTRPVNLIFPSEDGFEVNSDVIGCGVESGSLFPDYEVKPT